MPFSAEELEPTLRPVLEDWQRSTAAPDLEGRDGGDDERDPSRVGPHLRPVTTRLE